MRVLDDADLLWGMLCMVQQRRFPMRVLVDFWWMRRGSVCGAKERFGTTKQRINCSLTQELAYGESGGMVIASIDPSEHTVRLAAPPLAMRRERLERESVYAAHGDTLRKLAHEFDVYVMTQAGNPDSDTANW